MSALAPYVFPMFIYYIYQCSNYPTDYVCRLKCCLVRLHGRSDAFQSGFRVSMSLLIRYKTDATVLFRLVLISTVLSKPLSSVHLHLMFSPNVGKGLENKLLL